MEKIKTGYRDFIIGETSIYKFLLITFIEAQFIILYFYLYGILYDIFRTLGLYRINYDLFSFLGESLELLYLLFLVLYFTVPIFYKRKNRFLSINIIKDGIDKGRTYKIFYIAIKLSIAMVYCNLLDFLFRNLNSSSSNIILDNMDSSTIEILYWIYIHFLIFSIVYIIYRIRNKLAYKGILVGVLSFYSVTILTAIYIDDNFFHCTYSLYKDFDDEYGDYYRHDHCEKLDFLGNRFVDLSLIYSYEKELQELNEKEGSYLDKIKVENKLFNKVNSFKYEYADNRFYGYSYNIEDNYNRLLEQYSQGKRNKYIYIVKNFLREWIIWGNYNKNEIYDIDFRDHTSLKKQLKIAYDNVDFEFLEKPIKDKYADNKSKGIANYYLANINRNLGNYNKAEEYYKDAIQLGYNEIISYPERIDYATKELTELYINENKLDLARALYEKNGNIKELKKLSDFNIDLEKNSSILNERLFDAETYQLYKRSDYDEIMYLYSKSSQQGYRPWAYDKLMGILRVAEIKSKNKRDSSTAQENYLIGRMYYTGDVLTFKPDGLSWLGKRDYAKALNIWKNSKKKTEEMYRILDLYEIEEAKCKEDLKACFYSDWNLPKLYDEN